LTWQPPRLVLDGKSLHLAPLQGAVTYQVTPNVPYLWYPGTWGKWEGYKVYGSQKGQVAQAICCASPAPSHLAPPYPGARCSALDTAPRWKMVWRALYGLPEPDWVHGFWGSSVTYFVQ